MAKIDSHQHFWTYDAVRHAWITDAMSAIRRDFRPSDLQPVLAKHGFDGCVYVQVDQTEEETRQMLSIADNNDFVKGIVGWVDLRSPNLASRLDHFSEHAKLKGFRHIVQAEGPGFLLQPEFINGVKQLGDRKFTYDLLVYHPQLEESLGFLKQIPNTKIVIDHIAKPGITAGDIDQWKKHMTAIAAFDNVWCKVSGMVTEANWQQWRYEDFVPYLDVVVKAFGTDRVMYGSDWPVCLVAATYDQQLSIVTNYFESFSPSEKQKVFGGNAINFYNL